MNTQIQAAFDHALLARAVYKTLNIFSARVGCNNRRALHHF
ncbi:MAG: hypothetical protein U1E94_07410 [Agitococcus sp.]